MSSAGTSFLISQLGYRAPSLIVYLVAVVLACVFMSRATVPSILTLVGAGIMGATAIGSAVLQAYLIGEHSSGMPRFMPMIGVISSCISAVGLGFLVAAIFVGRDQVSRTKGRYLDEDEEDE